VPDEGNAAIEIRETTVYGGSSVWARVPVIRLLVDLGELEERPTDRIPGFIDRLMELMPSLEEHSCSLGHRGGFLERMRKGTWMGHVLEHVALELQGLAGATVGRGKTRGTGDYGRYNVVFEYRQEDVGRAAGQLARRILNHVIYGTEPGSTSTTNWRSESSFSPSGSPTVPQLLPSFMRRNGAAFQYCGSIRSARWSSWVMAATRSGSGQRCHGIPSQDSRSFRQPDHW
jgi:hypothetical protein